MESWTPWYVARMAGLTAIAIGQIAFVVLYWPRPWRKSAIGKAVYLFAANMAIAASLGALYGWFPHVPGEGPVKGVALWVLAIAVWAQLIVLRRTVRYEDHRPHPYMDPDQPESWYWIEHRPSGYWSALKPPEECSWVLVRLDLELEWFGSVDDAAEAMKSMIEMDLSVVAAAKRHGRTS